MKHRKFLSATEVAAAMGVSRQRVHQLLARGRIKGAQRVGFDGRWAIPIKVVILPAKNGRPRK